MTEKLAQALQNVETSYGDLIEIANSITDPKFLPINDIITKLNENIHALTTDQLRDYILTLQLKAFELSDIKEKSALKAVPVETALKIRNEGKKSIALKMLEEKSYNIIEIPSIKKRTFLESDYTILLEEKEND